MSTTEQKAMTSNLIVEIAQLLTNNHHTLCASVSIFVILIYKMCWNWKYIKFVYQHTFNISLYLSSLAVSICIPVSCITKQP